MWNDGIECGAEYDVAESDDSSPTGYWCSDALARSHGPKETHDSDFRSDESHKIQCCWLACTCKELEHKSQQLGGDCALSLRRWVNIHIPRKQFSNQRVELGVALVVQGAWLVMAPKRRSQVACGFADSACEYWLLTWSSKPPRDLPGCLQGRLCKRACAL